MAHISETRDLAKGIKLLLSEKGFAMFESPYLVDLIQKTEFDTIYHEHIFYLSIIPLKRLFDEFGLEIFRVDRSKIHGGSIQIFIQHIGGVYKKHNSVKELTDLELSLGLDKEEIYKRFSQKLLDLKVELFIYVS